jgi:hypothetical protein
MEMNPIMTFGIEVGERYDLSMGGDSPDFSGGVVRTGWQEIKESLKSFIAVFRLHSGTAKISRAISNIS